MTSQELDALFRKHLPPDFTVFSYEITGGFWCRFRSRDPRWECNYRVSHVDDLIRLGLLERTIQQVARNVVSLDFEREDHAERTGHAIDLLWAAIRKNLPTDCQFRISNVYEIKYGATKTAILHFELDGEFAILHEPMTRPGVVCEPGLPAIEPERYFYECVGAMIAAEAMHEIDNRRQLRKHGSPVSAAIASVDAEHILGIK